MLKQLCPIMPSRDFAATTAFYGRLGFASGYDDGGYLILSADAVRTPLFPRPRPRARAERSRGLRAP